LSVKIATKELGVIFWHISKC